MVVVGAKAGQHHHPILGQGAQVRQGGIAGVAPRFLGGFQRPGQAMRHEDAEAAGLQRGDHVVASFVPSCGHCVPCATGRPALCEPGAAANGAGTLLSGERRIHENGRAINHHLGVSAFAEAAVVSERSLVKIDKALAFDEAALFGCAVLTGMGAVVNTARVKAGDSVAIVGMGGRFPGAANIAEFDAALELLHLFALVQDDVMDRSDQRRGMPTLHVTAGHRHRDHHGLGDPQLFGDSVATLLGDLALAEASMLVAPSPEPVRDLWTLMTVELVHGQLWDITQTASRERRLAVSEAIARLKTGRYTVTRPLQLGALIAGAAPGLVADLGRYGDLVGDAFAIRDDILGVWGDPQVTGKPAGDDLRSAKPTVLLALAAEQVPPAGRTLLARCSAGLLDDAGVDALRESLLAWGVREAAETMIDELVGSADALLDALPIHPEGADALRTVAATAAWRST